MHGLHRSDPAALDTGSVMDAERARAAAGAVQFSGSGRTHSGLCGNRP